MSRPALLVIPLAIAAVLATGCSSDDEGVGPESTPTSAITSTDLGTPAQPSPTETVPTDAPLARADSDVLRTVRRDVVRTGGQLAFDCFS